MDKCEYDVKNLTTPEIEQMTKKLSNELKRRKEQEKILLIHNICTAMNELHAKYPEVTLSVEYRCPECGIDDGFDVIDYFCSLNNMSEKDFNGVF